MAPVVYCVPAVVRLKPDEEVAMLTLPENKAWPEVVSWVMLVVANVEVPLAVKSNTPLMSPPRTTPLDKVVVASLPIIVMLSAEVSPKTMSPFNVLVPLTHKPPDNSRISSRSLHRRH